LPWGRAENVKGAMDWINSVGWLRKKKSMDGDCWGGDLGYYPAKKEQKTLGRKLIPK